MKQGSIRREGTEQREVLFDENVEVDDCGGGYWDVGRMDVESLQCGALHYIAARAKQSTREIPIFSDCCNDGKRSFALDRDPPHYLCDLLTGGESQTKEFWTNI